MRRMVDAAVHACGWCGATLDIDWADVSTYSEPDLRAPIRIDCPTPGCGPRCPTCRRPAADIHGPHCGPIIMDKLGDLSPCTIARADCGPRWTA